MQLRRETRRDAGADIAMGAKRILKIVLILPWTRKVPRSSDVIASPRPVFKTNVKTFVSLKKATPPIPLADLLRITEFFPHAGAEFELDPAYEPERAKESPTDVPPDPAKNAVFAILQKYVKVNLVVPVGAPHMWHAAMQSKTCKLTVVGEHYRRLVRDVRI